MPRIEPAGRKEAVTCVHAFLPLPPALTQRLRLLGNQETKGRGCLIPIDTNLTYDGQGCSSVVVQKDGSSEDLFIQKETFV